MFVTRVLMRAPDPGLARAVVSHIERRPIDLARATRQWEELGRIFEACGWSRVLVEPHPDDPPCPDGAFVGDTVVSVGGRVILTRSAVESRRAERAAVRRTLSAAHVRVVPIRRPGTFDGGDLLQVRDTVYVGVGGGRTNRAGYAQVVDTLRRTGLGVVPVPLHKAAQLTAAVSALPDGTVLGYPPLVDDPSLFEDFVPVREPGGVHVVPLDGRRVLMAASAPETARLVERLGYEPIPVDIGEFEKREGTLTCLFASF